MHTEKSATALRGKYIIFEGIDGSGKSSLMPAVASSIRTKNKTVLTSHPGSTPLGKHIRQLVKFPHSIDQEINIDPLSRQLLYMVDTINFINTVLEPNLNLGNNVFADRSSFISAMIYGMCDGLDISEITKLFDLAKTPRADKLYILWCPWAIAKNRQKARETLDHYDSKPDKYFKSLEESYNSLITGSQERAMLVSRLVPLDSVIFINSQQSLDKVVETVVDDMRNTWPSEF